MYEPNKKVHSNNRMRGWKKKNFFFKIWKLIFSQKLHYAYINYTQYTQFIEGDLPTDNQKKMVRRGNNNLKKNPDFVIS
jgi:hypothetical protein